LILLFAVVILLYVDVLQRSYRKELFDDAMSRMSRACIKTDVEIEKFRQIQDKVESMVIQKARDERDYGEIPDEFRGEHQAVNTLKKT